MLSTQEESTAAIIQSVYHGYWCEPITLQLPSETDTVSLIGFSKTNRLRRELHGLTLTATRWQEILEFIRARLLSNQDLQKDISKSERARKRWQRAAFFSARLGRGMLHGGSDDALLLKTAHWLECVDTEHRYGSNLHFYHDYWKAQSDAHENFFHWLDHGGGKELDLPECPRSKLESEKLVYCSEEEREKFRVMVDPETRLLVYASSNTPVHTFPDPELTQVSSDIEPDSTGIRIINSICQYKTSNGFKFIYVISPTGNLYVHRKIRGRFQHSSFLAGQSVWGAGGIEVVHGKLIKVTLHSGHYRPTVKHLDRFVEYLKAQGVELDHVIKETFKNKGKKNFEMRNAPKP
ncbi:hypothetical protein K7432_018192 [Basidiobolus ranarum]|uniref:Uncharacterized protein n=1 Tax=Basidiobolus ranarum TaxID=34480 RepID=A0ABR2VJB3_9FUNG